MQDYIEYGNLNEKVEITVHVTTYNHEEYVRSALDGIVEQQVNVPFQVLVYDDASTDGTQEILIEYWKKYPELFHLFLSKINRYSKGLGKKFRREVTLKNTVGKYIASCEGDDYWINKHKLQIQYDYMEQHPECSMCFHGFIKDDMQLNCQSEIRYANQNCILKEKDIFNCTFNSCPRTVTTFYREEFYQNIPTFLDKNTVGDSPMRWWFAYNGEIHYLDGIWAVYRYMHPGSWNAMILEDKEKEIRYSRGHIESLIEYNQETKDKYSYYTVPMIEEFCAREICTPEMKTREELQKWVEECKAWHEHKLDALFDDIYKYALRYTQSSFDEFLEMTKKQPTYIYGAGEEATKFANKLNSLQVSYNGFIVTERQDQVEQFMGKSLYSLDEFLTTQGEQPYNLWLALNYRNWKEVKESLREKLRANM